VARPRDSTAAASTTGGRNAEAEYPSTLTVPKSKSPADAAAMAAGRADEVAAKVTRRRAEADKALANAEARRHAAEVAVAATVDVKERGAAAGRLSHAKVQRLNAERRVHTGRHHLTDGKMSKAATAD